MAGKRLSTPLLTQTSGFRNPFFSTSPTYIPFATEFNGLENVLLISTLLCSHYLYDIISQVIVWNNNPSPLTAEMFADTSCNPAKLKIHNSPSNIYFQARFIACAQAETPYCFIQDDDYLVRPEIIKAMRSFIDKEPSLYSVHLLPSREHLLSRLRTVVSYDKRISTSFAWLGHGTFVRRNAVVDFLNLLGKLNLAEDELQMADNYFTILANRRAETWLDHGIELGGGQPFTVGAEGDERNDKYTTRALESLFDITRSEYSKGSLPYVSIAAKPSPFSINRSPCLKGACLIESNINLTPAYNYSTVSHARELTPLVHKAQNMLKDEVVKAYLYNALSSAVDDNPMTSFRSPSDAKIGDWIALKILDGLLCSASETELQVVLLVRSGTARLLLLSRVKLLLTTDIWVDGKSETKCFDTDLLAEGPALKRDASTDKDLFLMECRFKIDYLINQKVAVQSIRIELLKDAKDPWEVHEIWLRRVVL